MNTFKRKKKNQKYSQIAEYTIIVIDESLYSYSNILIYLIKICRREY